MSPTAFEALLLVPLALIAASEAATDCLTSDSVSGKCVLGTQCTHIFRIKNDTALQKYRCGDSGNTQMVCCPHRYLEENLQLTAGTPRPGKTPINENHSEHGAGSQPLRQETSSLSATDCWLPSSNRGKCVPRTECPRINQIKNASVLGAYFCGFVGDSQKLCCPFHFLSQHTQPTTETPTTEASESRKKDFLDSNSEVSTGLRPPKHRLIPEECGRPHLGSKVAGGRNATEGHWPWQVLVLVIPENSEDGKTCGGSLISRKHVLSAAHCFVSKKGFVFPASLARVWLGGHDLSKNSHRVEREVSRLVLHENYKEASRGDDIALMFMAEDVTVNQYVSPVCLPHNKEAVPDDIAGEPAIATGWGLLSHGGEMPDILQEVDLPIWESERCWDAYNIRENRERFLCAGDKDGKKDTCSGDSGGPLVLLVARGHGRYYQIGITSFGHLCATKGLPGVYTRVTNYLGWINDHL